MFPEHKKLDLAKICFKVNSFWEQESVFKKSIQSKNKKPQFVFYEGPPSANGMPGIHHVMARLIKDIFCRYKTLSGYQVNRKAGWDTHGLPVELSVEKALNIKKEDIGKSISISEYNEECKKTVMKYTEKWNDLTKMMGYWVDVNNPYVTYENKYIETVWFLINRLFNKNLIYKGYTIQPYSPAAGTGLSSHELNQPGCYKMVKDLSATVLFEVNNPELLIKTKKPVFFMAWTTTPWTLFANTGLAVGKKIKYVFIETLNPITFSEVVLICAEDCLSGLFDEKTKKIILQKSEFVYKIIKRCSGQELVGLRYDPVLKHTSPLEMADEAFRVVDADFVSTNDGTGIVHLAPTFGSDDFEVAKKNNLPLMLVLDKNEKAVPIVDLSGRFVSGMGEFSGRFVKADLDDDKNPSVDVDVVVMLKKRGLIFKSEKYEHSYPHCWRTDKPILYYPLDSWFIKTTDYKDLMVEKNKSINWKPKSTGEGRFQNWLENINDWNISRSRFWGIPLPIWRCQKDNSLVCIGSVQELKKACEKSVKCGNMTHNPLQEFNPEDMSEENYSLFDLHKNYVDSIVLTSEKGEPMYREKDVIDVWFDSGSMPYAQWHYPFENKDLIDSGLFFPADFIAEGVDQTRGWFFTLHAISVMCFESVAYKNVISNGLVLDNLGQKMSKRIGNTVDPFSVIAEHGADAVRWYMTTNSQPWDNLKFDIAGVVEIKQKFFSTIYNIYSFFALYANIDKFKHEEPLIELLKRPLLDQWILSELNSLVSDVLSSYENYEPTSAARLIQAFVIDKLSNWYVRLCRRRFWKGEYDETKISAYQTLYDCLTTVAKISSPIAPFFMDQLFMDLNSHTSMEKHESVHLSRFPKPNLNYTNPVLEKKMRLTKSICSLALSLRKKESIRVRQPLESLTVFLNPPLKKGDVFVDIVLSEINVKNIFFSKDKTSFVKLKAVVNFPVVGKKHGQKMKKIVSHVNQFKDLDVALFEKNKYINLNIDGEIVKLVEGDLTLRLESIPGFLTAKTQDVVISLNTQMSQELLNEGFSREFVNRIQSMRKNLGFSVMSKISVLLFGNTDAINIVLENKQYIQSEVLAVSIVQTNKKPKNNSLFEFNNYKLYIAIDNK